MKVFELEVHGRSREIYHVLAESPTDAYYKFRRGEVSKPLVTEIEDAYVVKNVEVVKS